LISLQIVSNFGALENMDVSYVCIPSFDA
jgi:hypothetical protein